MFYLNFFIQKVLFLEIFISLCWFLLFKALSIAVALFCHQISKLTFSFVFAFPIYRHLLASTILTRDTIVTVRPFPSPQIAVFYRLRKRASVIRMTWDRNRGLVIIYAYVAFNTDGNQVKLWKKNMGFIFTFAGARYSSLKK